MSGCFHAFGITDKGIIYTWGDNRSGQLGIGQLIGQNEPVIMERFYSDVRFKKIICGSFHTYGIDKDECIYAWGDNSDGQLGIGEYPKATSVPTIITITTNLKFKKIICRNLQTFAFDVNDNLYAWGEIETFNIPTPTLVQSNMKLIKIICGSFSMYGISDNGEIYMNGYDFIAKEKRNKLTKTNMIFVSHNENKFKLSLLNSLVLKKEADIDINY